MWRRLRRSRWTRSTRCITRTASSSSTPPSRPSRARSTCTPKAKPRSGARHPGWRPCPHASLTP
eukprot:scaffold21104_cov34-Isochrysis_galbana.AAC.1